MDFKDAFTALESYDLWLFIIGLAVLAATVLPRFLAEYPLSFPMALVVLGFAAVALPFGLEGPDPLEYGDITERLTELGVIISLTGAGLKIDRRVTLKGWASSWRLLTVTMLVSIAGAAFIGLWVAAFVPATAMLLGAVAAPTDPVLASEVQVGAPNEGSDEAETETVDKTGPGEEDEVRFALTSEAGLNDGLAFPFTNMAIAMAIAGANPGNWFKTWLLIDVLYKLGVAAIVGLGLGYVMAVLIMKMPAKTLLTKGIIGLSALSSTLIVYGATELAGGYGFIATFIGAVVIRSRERSHEYHKALHLFSEKSERIITIGILLALGAAVADGLLAPLTWPLILSAVLIVFLLRPAAGILALLGFKKIPWREKLTIAFFGIKGIGSLYYLSYALNEEHFPGEREIWALVALVILISIFVHGILAAPIMLKLDKLREGRKNYRD